MPHTMALVFLLNMVLDESKVSLAAAMAAAAAAAACPTAADDAAPVPTTDPLRDWSGV